MASARMEQLHSFACAPTQLARRIFYCLRTTIVHTTMCRYHLNLHNLSISMYKLCRFEYRHTHGYIYLYICHLMPRRNHSVFHRRRRIARTSMKHLCIREVYYNVEQRSSFNVLVYTMLKHDFAQESVRPVRTSHMISTQRCMRASFLGNSFRAAFMFVVTVFTFQEN
jgi:hypothetical protein